MIYIMVSISQIDIIVFYYVYVQNNDSNKWVNIHIVPNLCEFLNLSLSGLNLYDLRQ